MPELGIVDIREIIGAVKSDFDYDFGNYALTSFKQRLERIMVLYNICNAEGLIMKLRSDSDFFDTFLYEITVPSSEMFRDPSLWRWLIEACFTGMVDKSTGKSRIWLPACVSGAELYSLAILISEAGLLDKVHIIASCLSNKSIELMKSGFYDLKKMEVSVENFKRVNSAKDLSIYYKSGHNFALRDTRLIQNVEFLRLNINFDNAPQNIRLILFRNSMIYYNPTQQEKILHVIYNSLSPSGYLVVGIKEKISGINTGRDFEIVNETESVYRKRLFS